MSDVKYPKDLTKKHWDKKKPLLAKTVKTGVGAALTDLESSHQKIKWKNFEPFMSIATVDKLLKEWPKKFASEVKPVAVKASKVRALAEKAAKEFAKKKAIPKSAVKEAMAIAKAAKSFESDLLDYEGLQAKVIVKERQVYVGNLRKSLKPIWAKSLKKIEGLLKDTRTYLNNPNEATFDKVFSGDSNARGYTTACKNWDQFMQEFPELTKQCMTKKAMDVFFPGMELFGSNWELPTRSQYLAKGSGKTGSEGYLWAAKQLSKEVKKIQTFKAVIEKAVSLLDKMD